MESRYATSLRERVRPPVTRYTYMYMFRRVSRVRTHVSEQHMKESRAHPPWFVLRVLQLLKLTCPSISQGCAYGRLIAQSHAFKMRKTRLWSENDPGLHRAVKEPINVVFAVCRSFDVASVLGRQNRTHSSGLDEHDKNPRLCDSPTTQCSFDIDI